MLEFSIPTWPTKRPRRWQPEALGLITQYFSQAGTIDPAVISAIMGSGKSLLLCELCAIVKLNPGDCIVVSTSTAQLTEDLTADLRRRCGNERSVGIWYGKQKRPGQITVCCIDSLQGLSKLLESRQNKVVLWIADEAHRTECSTVLVAHQTLRPLHALGLTATPFRSSDKEAITLFKTLLYRYGVHEAQKDGNVLVGWDLVHASHDLSDTDDLDAACAEMIFDARGPGLANAVDIADAEAFATYLTERNFPAAAVHSKLSSHDNRVILEKLKNKQLRCVVHVNLLTEGSNYPWICWMLLRREVESRVRFAQEMGRGLRTCDDLIWGEIRKEKCTFYDPHDQFGGFDLSYAEALGEPPPQSEREVEIREPMELAERIHEADPPVAMAWIESAVRTLCVACDCAQMLGDRKVIKKAERLKPSNEIQQAALKSAIYGVEGIAPAGWMKLLEEISYRPDSVRFGFAADLLRALTGIRGQKRWPPLDEERRITTTIQTDVRTPAPVAPKPGQLELFGA